MPIFRLVLYGSDQTDRTEPAATGAWHLRETPGTLANRGSGNGCLAPEGKSPGAMTRGGCGLYPGGIGHAAGVPQVTCLEARHRN